MAIKEEDLRLNIIVNGDPARKELLDVRTSISDLTAKVAQQKTELKTLAKESGKSSDAYKALSKTINSNETALAANKKRLKELQDGMKVSDMTIQELRDHIKQLIKQMGSMDPASAQWAQYKKDLTESKKRLKELSEQSENTKTSMITLADSINRFGFMLDNLKSIWGEVSSLIDPAVDAYREYDEVLTDAMKTTNLTKEEITEVSDELKKVDTRTAQNELMQLVRIGGKLGITGQEDLLGFARAADKINVALAEDLGGNAEAAIQTVGKMVDIFNLNAEYGIEDAMLRVGSAINELGMASTANEGYMVNFT